MKTVKKVLHVLMIIAIVAAAIAVVMLLWNALIPSIIGWSAIGYWQAAGLMVLSKLLFGGFGRHHGHGFCGKHHGKHAHFHKAMKGMSRDERREFIRERMKRGFEGYCDNNDSSSPKSEE